MFNTDGGFSWLTLEGGSLMDGCEITMPDPIKPLVVSSGSDLRPYTGMLLRIEGSAVVPDARAGELQLLRP